VPKVRAFFRKKISAIIKLFWEASLMEVLSKGKVEERHRLIILTDMENEPDDSQTMVKLLMYSNEIDIEALVSVTSRWLKHSVYPESIADRVMAYGAIRKNLFIHASGWPTQEYLLERIAGGQRDYGMNGVGNFKSSPGSELIVQAVDKDDPRPVIVAINAGSNTLAQALWDVKKSRTSEETARFVSKIRVYDDSGQDNAGAWMCNAFPDLFYIRSRQQVFGLFGPTNGAGPQSWEPLDQYDWAEQNIRTRHGVLGALYPQRFVHRNVFEFMDGGGTTTWIGLVNKGLFDPAEISWGGWGGRFSWDKEQVKAGQRTVDEEESQYAPWLMYPEAKDHSWTWTEGVTEFNTFSWGGDETLSTANFAPLWRWRNAYTSDFKARMDWCVCDYKHANHHPVAVVFDDESRTIVRLKAAPGEELNIDASKSWDPDNDILAFNWFIYPEAGTYEGNLEIINPTAPNAEMTIPDDAKGKQIHLILELRDDDSEAPLTSYRRIVIDVE
jgi:hypothetical protein